MIVENYPDTERRRASVLWFCAPAPGAGGPRRRGPRVSMSNVFLTFFADINNFKFMADRTVLSSQYDLDKTPPNYHNHCTQFKVQYMWLKIGGGWLQKTRPML